MIQKELSQRIITISGDYRNPRGGIAMVVNSYEKIFEIFQVIIVTKGRNRIAKLFSYIYSILTFVMHSLKDRYDVVHIHSASWNSFKMRRIFIVIAYLYRKKIIFHCHGGEFKLFYEQSNTLIKRSLNKVDIIVALSTEWKEFFKEKFPNKKVVIIPNIIPLPKADNHNRSVIDDSDIISLLYLGLINEKKGIFDLLNVISNNKNKYINKLFLKIGGNGNVDYLVKYIDENNLNSIVSFEGWVGGDEKISLLRDADIYILPSYNEGLPISILEAMSYNCPIISTRVGGIPQIVDNTNGILFDPGDVKQIELILDKICCMNKIELKRMGEISYYKVKPYLSDNVENQLTRLYESIITN